MNDYKIYCMCLHEHHLKNLKKLRYIPVGLGQQMFSKEWLRDNTGENISNKTRTMENIHFTTGSGKMY